MHSIDENTQECQIIQKVLLANKIDLNVESHRVAMEDGRQLASKHGVEFFQVSAKEGLGINEALTQLTKSILKAQQQRKRSNLSTAAGDVVVLHDIPVHAEKDKKCCGK